MRRAVARGRVFPQKFSTDRRYGRLSLKAVALFPLMWANTDDQGRLSGEPDEIKYAVCPNIEHISKDDIPEIIEELTKNNLILSYDTPKTKAIQMLDWWDECKLQWAWPSDYPHPEGWQDRLRYKRGAKEVVTFNWDSASPESSPENSAENSPEQTLMFPPSPTNKRESNKEKISGNDKEVERGNGNRRGRGRGNSPENSGEKHSPSSITLSTQEKDVFDNLMQCFRIGWGKVRADNLKDISPREPNFREVAMLRDLAIELSAAGGCQADMIKQAFSEAAGQQKYHISYVRAVLLDWKGVSR